jgi:hypothetical protein
VKPSRTRALALAMAFLAILFVSFFSAVSLPVAHAQNLGERTVSGTVLDDAANRVQGATVFLKNQKSKTIRSFTSLDNGHFYFAQVNKAEDFDLWAEKDGKKSEVKTVSSWDDRAKYITDLKLK